MKTKNEIYDYALSFFGLPYVWGGSGPNRFDCSGFVQEILKFIEITFRDRLNAQELFDTLSETASYSVEYAGFGGLCFYGESIRKINHVTYAFDSRICIGAIGGGPDVTNIAIAKQLNASIKIVPINYRKDVVGIIMPNYIG